MSNRLLHLVFTVLLSAVMVPAILTAAPHKEEEDSFTRSVLQEVVVDEQIELSERSLNSRKIIVVLADPNSGEILAVASRSRAGSLPPESAFHDARSFHYAPGSTVSIVPNDALAKAGLGDGKRVTPIQMVMAYSAIANGGILLKPRFGLESAHSPCPGVRIFSEGVASGLRESLRHDVMATKTLLLARVQGMQVAGSAGHSQEREWLGITRHTTVSFIGFFPAQNPKFVCLVVVKDAQHVLPKFNRGCLVAAPEFSRIAEKIERYLKRLKEITPSDE